MLLALDTSTDAISVAVHDGRAVLVELTVDASRRHAEVLVPLIDQALRSIDAAVGDLTAIAVGTGPGAFTGLRVGLVTARTMALALELPCHGVGSLDAVAHAALSAGAATASAPFAVAMDARRGEVFWARYVNGRREGAPRADPPDVAIASALDGLTVVGDVETRHPGCFARVIAATPSAASVAAIALDAALGFDVGAPEPVYVRRPDAAEPGARKQVTPAGRA